MKNVIVIDGQSGRMGQLFIERAKAAGIPCELTAVGTNALATAAMLKAGADEGATGENAVIFNVKQADVLLGPIGILSANGLLGEVTPAMAEAIGSSDAVKILLPSQRCSIRLAVGPGQPMQVYLEDAMRLLGEELQQLAAK